MWPTTILPSSSISCDCLRVDALMPAKVRAAPDSLYAKAAIALLSFMQADCRFLFRMDGLLAGGEVCAVA